MAERPHPPRRLPVPAPLRPWVLMPFLAGGVVGTGLLYRAATQGNLGDLLGGAVLFALGMWFAGRPFVLATTWRRDLRRRGPPPAKGPG